MGYEAAVVHRPDERRYVYEDGGAVAQLVYRRDGARLILVHTEVPDELGGQGIGGRLVSAAVDDARSNGWTVVPWCPFARRWIETHADHVEGVTVDWSQPPSSGPRDHGR